MYVVYNSFHQGASTHSYNNAIHVFWISLNFVSISHNETICLDCEKTEQWNLTMFMKTLLYCLFLPDYEFISRLIWLQIGAAPSLEGFHYVRMCTSRTQTQRLQQSCRGFKIGVGRSSLKRSISKGELIIWPNHIINLSDQWQILEGKKAIWLFHIILDEHNKVAMGSACLI